MNDENVFAILDELSYREQGGCMNDIEHDVESLAENYSEIHNQVGHAQREYFDNLSGYNVHRNDHQASDSLPQHQTSECGSEISQKDFEELAFGHSHQSQEGVSGPQTSRRKNQHQLGSQVQPHVAHRLQNLVQGIQLVSTKHLPTSFQSVFSFANFNAVQSKCFDFVYGSNDNLVLSSPTGSGKTVVFELAICRLHSTLTSGTYKIVYQAPTKALCTERARDWKRKFQPLGLNCTEFTGDSEKTSLNQIRDAEIIITTPEKWDSMTRRWKDQKKLMLLIKLFLIDEIHMLKDERGATLEAVVSRMKSIDSNVRFVALSATIPNAEDIAAWIGQNPRLQSLPAKLEVFGENFRPVVLQKHVVGFDGGQNMFQFDSTLSKQIGNIIKKYSEKKPIMVFCATQRMAEQTAMSLAEWWASSKPSDRYWNPPAVDIPVRNDKLKSCVTVGVAFHHGGVDVQDRAVVEQRYLQNNNGISVICCTSTLAVGVNLPCHLVIIKGTQKWTETGPEDLSSLEVLQMLGRAGRPQFDTSAKAVIMTQKRQIKRWERMVSGDEILESRLHLNLIEHINSEICLGTITDMKSANQWLRGTFLAVRLRKNPQHYDIDGIDSMRSASEIITEICKDQIYKLQDAELIKNIEPFKSTQFGTAMSSYFINFKTMMIFMALPPHNFKLSEMLSAICQADELREYRFRQGEKPVFKKMNGVKQLRYDIPVNLELPAHKVSLLIQAELGGVDFPVDKDNRSLLEPHHNDRKQVLSKIKRFINCIADIAIARGDSTTLKTALMFNRSVSASGWDDTPMQMKQVEVLKVRMIRGLVARDIKSLEALEHAEQHVIELSCNMPPPFGRKVLDFLGALPKLRVSISLVGKPKFKAGSGADLVMKTELGFLNEQSANINKASVFVILVAETSDGTLLYFNRLSTKKVATGHSVQFGAHLDSPMQTVLCHVLCEEIAGSMKSATFKPTIPSLAWPLAQSDKQSDNPTASAEPRTFAAQDTIRSTQKTTQQNSTDEFGFDADDDAALMDAANNIDCGNNSQGFEDIDTVFTRTREKINTRNPRKPLGQRASDREPSELARLPNGKYQCLHRCKDKRHCGHHCCKDGMDKPPRPSKQSQKQANTQQVKQNTPKNSSSTSRLPIVLQNTNGIGELDLTAEPTHLSHRDTSPAMKALQQLHTKAGQKSQGNDFDSRRYDVQRRNKGDMFHLPKLDDEQFDEIIDSDDRAGHQLTGSDTMYLPQPPDLAISGDSLHELSNLYKKSQGAEPALVNKYVEMTGAEFDDNDFDDYLDWDAIDATINNNNVVENAVVMQQESDDPYDERILPMPDSDISTLNSRKRPAEEHFTSRPCIQTSVRESPPLLQLCGNLLSPAKRLKTVVPSTQKMVQMGAAYSLGSMGVDNNENEDPLDQKLPFTEIEAWFNREFGDCVRLVDLIE